MTGGPKPRRDTIAGTTDADLPMSSCRAKEDATSQQGANHPRPLRPMAHVHPEPSNPPAGGGDEIIARVGERPASGLGSAVGGEDVAQLAEALRAAKRSHIQYLAELRQADVEPSEDWATWYAEYLLGVR
jgi:hypothetical protein